MPTFRLVDVDGNVLGELKDAESVWGFGDMITFEGRDLKVVNIGVFNDDEELPVLVVKPV